MNTTDVLNKRISLCLDIHAKSYHSILLFDALNSIRTGKYKIQIENIRRLYSLGKSAIAGYKSKKKQLSSFIFSGIFLLLFSAGFYLIQDSNLTFVAIPLL